MRKESIILDQINELLAANHLKHVQVLFGFKNGKIIYKLAHLDLPGLKEKVIKLINEKFGDELVLTKELKTILRYQIKEEN